MKFRIYRYDPESGAAPRMQDYEIDFDPQGLFDAAVGWMVPFNDRFGLRVEARNLIWVPKDDFSGAKQRYRVVGAGLNWSFGGTPKDDDGDG